MEDSLSSCMQKRAEEEKEESGWTAYFDDYCSCYSSGTSSIWSKLLADQNHITPAILKKLRLKKSTRTKQISRDDSLELEDTASSPLNTDPKVSDLKAADDHPMMNLRTQQDIRPINNSLVNDVKPRVDQ